VGGLVDPRGLVLDLPKNRMFWTDPKARSGEIWGDMGRHLPEPDGLDRPQGGRA